MEQKIQNQHVIKQKSDFENEKIQLEDEIKREEEFTHASSFVGSVTYTIDFQSMEIELNGRIYNYCSVPQRIYDSFKGAGSKGKFFNRVIKGIYEC